jgi:hypothetical protein
MDDATYGKGHPAMQLMAGDVTESFAGAVGAAQEAVRAMMDLGTSTSQEATRSLVERSQVHMELARRFQEAAFRWQSMWPEMLRDPVQWYLHSLEEHTAVTRECFAAMRKDAEVISTSLQRMEASAAEASRVLQKTLTDAAGRVPDGFRRIEARRAA